MQPGQKYTVFNHSKCTRKEMGWKKETRERVIIFTGKTRQYLMIFQLSLAPFYHGTLFPLFPWKMFSSSSIVSVAQQLLATFPM